jgi:hypothetical protein
MSYIIKYDYRCNQCGKLEAGLTGEPPDWLHGSLTPYPTDKKENPITNHEINVCSWECASAFAAAHFSWSSGLRGVSLALFERDKEKKK